MKIYRNIWLSGLLSVVVLGLNSCGGDDSTDLIGNWIEQSDFEGEMMQLLSPLVKLRTLEPVMTVMSGSMISGRTMQYATVGHRSPNFRA
jgi:hypothetical protein